MTRLLVVGAGRMGSALVGGIVRAGVVASDDITVVDPDEGARRAAAAMGVRAVTAPETAEGAILAVKPAFALDATRAIAAAGCNRLLSVVAGVPTSAIEAAASSRLAVVRSMPNTPALVGAGVTAISAGSTAGEEELVWAEALLGAVGEVVRVPERLLDAVTGLSGSGPAYVFLVIEALVEAGVLLGLDRPTATTLAAGTVRGAAQLLLETGESPAALRAGVTSPGGTTAAGLRVLEQRGVRAAFLDAVTAATARSTELGQ